MPDACVTHDQLLDRAPTRTVVYKQTEHGTLHLHMFEPDRERFRGPRPAIVLFHGGGWNGGQPSQLFPQAAYLASRGMAAMSVAYRLRDKHGTSPTACVADGKTAMRYVRSHADALGVDPARIAAGGGSAGGHVAAATAVIDGFNDPGDDPAVACRPDALVLFNPVYDNGPEGYGYERVGDIYRDFSPAHNIRPGMPPAVVFFGADEALQTRAAMERFRDDMRAAGARSELHVYDGYAHGFFNPRPDDPFPFVATLIETDRFLASLGWLEGEPTLAPA